MSKIVSYIANDSLKAKVKKAVADMAALVGTTLGPGGRVVFLQQPDGKPPTITKDGVTVAEHHSGSDPVERIIVDAAREVCQRTARQAGDGTTTAIVLAAALTDEGQSYLTNNANVSPQALCRELRSAMHDKIEPSINSLSKKISSLPLSDRLEAMRRVALVSANHDSEIAVKVAEAMDLVGENGIVMAEEGAGADTSIRHEDGYFCTIGLRDIGGAASAAFVNRPSRDDCVIDACYVLLYDGDLRTTDQIEHVIAECSSEMVEGRHIRTPLVIFCHGYGEPVLRMIAKGFRTGQQTVLPMITQRNGQTHGKSLFLQDLAAYVGGEVFDPQNGIPTSILPRLGFALQVIAGQSETIIRADDNDPGRVARVQSRVFDLKEQMATANQFDADRIRYRIGQLNGGIATIYAGGYTSLEAKERHARVVDAVSAVRSALLDGVVPGGGATLVEIAKGLSDSGAEGILKRAIRVPFARIMENAGVSHKSPDGNHYIHPKLAAMEPGPKEDGKFMVFDALKTEYVDWWEAGILDPTRVTLSALSNALSVAQLMMTLGGVVALQTSADEDNIKAMQDAMLRAVNQQE